MVNVRVLLVDADALVRAGLRMILSAVQDLQVVGEAGDGAPSGCRGPRAPTGRRTDGHPHARMDGIAAAAALRRLDVPPKGIGAPIPLWPVSTQAALAPVCAEVP